MATLDGKVALITGRNQGIGKDIAIRLARDGAKVVVNYRCHPEAAKKTLDDIKSVGGDCHLVKGYGNDQLL